MAILVLKTNLDHYTLLAYSVGVEFIETAVFSRIIYDLLDDDRYSDLQSDLIDNPNAGDVIPGSGGIRKIRWSAKGRGKRGGIRVIYYLMAESKIYILYVYNKRENGDLTKDQIKMLRDIVSGE